MAFVRIRASHGRVLLHHYSNQYVHSNQNNHANRKLFDAKCAFIWTIRFRKLHTAPSEWFCKNSHDIKLLKCLPSYFPWYKLNVNALFLIHLASDSSRLPKCIWNQQGQLYWCVWPHFYSYPSKVYVNYFIFCVDISLNLHCSPLLYRPNIRWHWKNLITHWKLYMTHVKQQPKYQKIRYSKFETTILLKIQQLKWVVF